MKILTKGTYYGAMRSEVRVNGIVLSEYNYESPQTDWHYHENPYFMYVIQGNMYDINKKGKSQCVSGDLLFHNWQDPHQNTRESRFARGFHMEFERSWFEEKRWDIALWEGSRILEHPELHQILAQLYYEFKCQDSFSEVSIELLLLRLCERLEINSQTTSISEPAWVPRLKELLQDTKKPVSLASLSEDLDVHPAHLSRAIPKYLNTTLGDYLRRQKVQRSLGYIMDSNYSLTEISYLCGFSDQSHFIRAFKMYFGITPKTFRRQLSA